jgi:hypothetical protein
MKIYRKNGTIIEMTVEEYKTAFLKKDRNEFINEYKEATTPYKEPSTPSKRTKIDMAEYMREYRKKKQSEKHGGYGRRKSSCLKWRRSEDKVIKENVDNMSKAKKLLKGRTLIAVYSRRQKLRELGKIKDYKRATRKDVQNDGRYKMMKYVAKELKDITTVRPQMPINDARKLAFQRYREHKGDNNGSK